MNDRKSLLDFKSLIKLTSPIEDNGDETVLFLFDKCLGKSSSCDPSPLATEERGAKATEDV